jgi:nucleoid DNA-binding protein
MTRSDLIQHLAEKKKLAWQHAEVLAEAVFASMQESLGRGERIEIRGFGTFQVRSYKGTGRRWRDRVPADEESAFRRGLREIGYLVAHGRARATATSQPVETEAAGPQTAEA